jgi:hypothetical protein
MVLRIISGVWCAELMYCGEEWGIVCKTVKRAGLLVRCCNVRW